MSDSTPTPPPNGDAPHWTARHGKPIIFVILTLVAVGIYLAFTIPVAVFPDTNFPRIVVGVDNGVVAHRPDAGHGDASRSKRPSIPCKGSITYGPSPAAARRKSTCSSIGKSICTVRLNWSMRLWQACNRRCRHRQDHGEPSDFCGVSHYGLQPDIQYRFANRAVGNGHLRTEAAAEPSTRRFQVVVQGGQVPEFQVQPDPSKMVQTQLSPFRIFWTPSRRSNMIDSPGLMEKQAPTRARPGQRAGEHAARDRQHRD